MFSGSRCFSAMNIKNFFFLKSFRMQTSFLRKCVIYSDSTACIAVCPNTCWQRKTRPSDVIASPNTFLIRRQVIVIMEAAWRATKIVGKASRTFRFPSSALFSSCRCSIYTFRSKHHRTRHFLPFTLLHPPPTTSLYPILVHTYENEVGRSSAFMPRLMKKSSGGAD